MVKRTFLILSSCISSVAAAILQCLLLHVIKKRNTKDVLPKLMLKMLTSYVTHSKLSTEESGSVVSALDVFCFTRQRKRNILLSSELKSISVPIKSKEKMNVT